MNKSRKAKPKQYGIAFDTHLKIDSLFVNWCAIDAAAWERFIPEPRILSSQTKLFTSDVLNKLQVTEDDLQDDEESISEEESVSGPVDKRQSVISSKGKKIRKAGQHQFEDQTFKKPKFCFYCKSLIKGN